MSTKFTLRRIAASALLAGVGTVACLGFSAGTAEARGPIDVWSNYEWCPGEALPQADAPITWDMNTCHFYHYQSIRDGAPSLWHIEEGIRPSQCPPIAFMCP